MSKQIKLMPDYHCHPLWLLGPDFDKIEAATLPLTSTTMTRLEAWAKKYDATLNEDYPPDSVFATPEEEEEFEREGMALWLQLRKELAVEYEVVYHSYRFGHLMTRPSELKRWPSPPLTSKKWQMPRAQDVVLATEGSYV